MDRREYIYYRFMKKVVEDDFISLDESGLVLVLEERLGLSDDRMDDIMTMIREGREPAPDDLEGAEPGETEHLVEKDLYERVLREACSDERITDRELDLLEFLAKIMGLNMEDRRDIFTEAQCSEDLSGRLEKALKLQ